MTSWAPATPAEAFALFDGCGAPWWIAGGYALELVAGRSWRSHGDLDVLVLRRDQLMVQRVLAGWEWWAADPPGTLRPWLPDEVLPEPVIDVWCRLSAGSPWRIQVMLDSASGGSWVSRRNPSVRRALPDVGVSVGGIPCLRPEIQLFYKAGSPRPKDTVDFSEMLPSLDPLAVGWLREAIAGTYGPEHAWLGDLDS